VRIPELCAGREVEQETGFRPGRIERLSGFYSTPGFCEEILHVFLATDLTPTRQQLDHDELVEVHLLALEEALQMVDQGEIVDSKTIIALLLATRMRPLFAPQIRARDLSPVPQKINDGRAIDGRDE
jgi:ADP-ribose pyrophosphatase